MNLFPLYADKCSDGLRAYHTERIQRKADLKQKAAKYMGLVYAAAGVLSGEPLVAGIGAGLYLGIKGLEKLEDRKDKKSGLEQKLE